MPAATAVHFFLELAAILVACRVVGLASQRLGQPQVVGEMIAGVLLGPSLLGRIAPDVQHHLFPPGPPNVVLYTAAQIGPQGTTPLVTAPYQGTVYFHFEPATAMAEK